MCTAIKGCVLLTTVDPQIIWFHLGMCDRVLLQLPTYLVLFVADSPFDGEVCRFLSETACIRREAS